MKEEIRSMSLRDYFEYCFGRRLAIPATQLDTYQYLSKGEIIKNLMQAMREENYVTIGVAMKALLKYEHLNEMQVKSLIEGWLSQRRDKKRKHSRAA